MLDKVLAIISVSFLIGFLGIVVWRVPEPDLIIVTVVVSAMVLYDFYRSDFRKKDRS
ncbi:MAG: hypothetical protein HKM95_05185 [Inquilinus sp.]|nr:hypothetical protein [Inquilinus sp.]